VEIIGGKRPVGGDEIATREYHWQTNPGWETSLRATGGGKNDRVTG
jgi:hypothetical protein